MLFDVDNKSEPESCGAEFGYVQNPWLSVSPTRKAFNIDQCPWQYARIWSPACKSGNRLETSRSFSCSAGGQSSCGRVAAVAPASHDRSNRPAGVGVNDDGVGFEPQAVSASNVARGRYRCSIGSSEHGLVVGEA